MPSRKLFYLFLGFVILFVYSCSGGYVKYPSYFSYKKTTQTYPKESKQNIEIFSKGIGYLEANRCDDAVNYFKNMKGFKADYCLAVSYAYCSKLQSSNLLLKKIEPKSIDSIWHSRVYALMSLVDFLHSKKLFKDYATIAYAYDANDKLASILMFKKTKKLSFAEKEKYFNMVFDWCKEFDVIDK